MAEAKYFAAAILVVAAALLSGVIIFSVRAIRKWRGFFRIAAALPVFAFAIMAVFIAVQVMGDPTSHNLWPFEFVLWGICSLVYLGILALLRRFISR